MFYTHTKKNTSLGEIVVFGLVCCTLARARSSRSLVHLYVVDAVICTMKRKGSLLIQSIQVLEPGSSISVSVLLASLVWLSLTLTARKLFGNFTLQNPISLEPGYRHLNIIRVEFCS